MKKSGSLCYFSLMRERCLPEGREVAEQMRAISQYEVSWGPYTVLRTGPEMVDLESHDHINQFSISNYDLNNVFWCSISYFEAN